MKKLNRALIVTALFTGLMVCNPELPQIRVQNQNTKVVDVALKPPSGSTIDINYVSGGNESSYIEVPTSNYEVYVNVENVTPNVTTHFLAEEDGSYTIVVSDSTPPTVNVR